MRIPIPAVALAAFFMPAAALSQIPAAAVCGDRSRFLSHLAQTHKETPSAMGVTDSGRVLEVLTSKDGTWTIIVTHPNGITCMVTAGQAWENIEPAAEGPVT
ncbi:MAG: hypothetical protein O2967_17775 [Proteobacteria bacterium]|nr:hypothetical protein [Pseudomonadota bacterium]